MDNYPLVEGLRRYTPIHANDAYYYGDKTSLLFREVTVGYVNQSAHETVTHAKHIMQLHKNLESFNIAVAPYSVIVPNIANTILMATEFVCGDVFTDNDYVAMNAQKQEQALRLLSSLTSYLDTAIKSGSPHLGDVYGLHQYVFTETRPVLVDIDPHIIEERATDPLSFSSEMMCIEHLARMGVQLLATVPAEKEKYLNTIFELIRTSCDANELHVDDEEISACVKDIIDDEEYDTSLFADEIARKPENHIYQSRVRQKMTRIENAYLLRKR